MVIPNMFHTAALVATELHFAYCQNQQMVSDPTAHS